MGGGALGIYHVGGHLGVFISNFGLLTSRKIRNENAKVGFPCVSRAKVAVVIYIHL